MTTCGIDLAQTDEKCVGLLREMAGCIAHDFNNMITPLVAYPDLIRDSLPPEEESAQYLAAMDESVSALRSLCERLLAFSGRTPCAISDLSIGDVVESAVETVRLESSSPNVRIETAIVPGSVRARARATDLETAIVELCRNSLEAMPLGGHLLVETREVIEEQERISGCGVRVAPGRYSQIRVTDTGRGIPPEMRRTVVSPFVSDKRGKGRRGSGLGLSIVCVVARDHGGYLDIESRPGPGTVVTMALRMNVPDGGAA